MKTKIILFILLMFSFKNGFSQKIHYKYLKDTIGINEKIKPYEEKGNTISRREIFSYRHLMQRIALDRPLKITMTLNKRQDGFFEVDSKSDSLFINLFRDKRIIIKDSSIVYKLIPRKKLTRLERWLLKDRKIRFDSTYTYLDVRTQKDTSQDLYHIKEIVQAGRSTSEIRNLMSKNYTSITFYGLKNNLYTFHISGAYSDNSISIEFAPQKGITYLEINGCIYRLVEVYEE